MTSKCRDCGCVLYYTQKEPRAILSGRCDGCQEKRDIYYQEKADHERQYYGGNDDEEQD